jgi:hypothetical protein
MNPALFAFPQHRTKSDFQSNLPKTIFFVSILFWQNEEQKFIQKKKKMKMKFEFSALTRQTEEFFSIAMRPIHACYGCCSICVLRAEISQQHSECHKTTIIYDFRFYRQKKIIFMDFRLTRNDDNIHINNNGAYQVI